jgi:DNA-binding MarR family transcriptional regulator
LLAERFLERAPGRRLRPGGNFGAERPPPATHDEIDEAVLHWAEGHGAGPSRAYELTARILRLARLIELGTERNGASEGLNAGEVLVLDALYRLGPPYRATPTSLKRHFLVSLAGVGKRVDHLQRLGFIERAPAPNDGRSVLIGLTEEGRQALARLAAADRRAPYIAWTAALSPQEHALVSRVLRDAERFVEDADAALPGER